MIRGKSRRLAVAAAAIALVAAGTVAVLATTARADNAVPIGTCSASGDGAECTITGAMTNGAEMFGGVSATAGLEVNITDTVTCDQNGQVTTQPGFANGESNGMNVPYLNLPASVSTSQPSSCEVSVTAQNLSAGTSTLLLTYLPYILPATSSPSPSASATPSPSGPPVHLVRGFDGMCLRDTGDSAAERTKIVMWACDPAAQGQGWTYRGDELRIHGDMCVNAKGRGTKGSPLILWSCNGSANEIWIHRSNGEYALKANGGKLCLTDPAYSTGDGTQVVVGVCSDARDQRWSLP